jgi:hypothetical protein
MQKFGRTFMLEQGQLPWRTAEFYGELQRALSSLTRPNPPTYALDNIVYYAAILTHYVSDGHVPFHAVVNYDGQLTGQRGIHARFEDELFDRYHSRTTFSPPPVVPILNAEETAWTVLLDSHRSVDELLKADQAATAGLEWYDDTYFDRLYHSAGPLMTQQVSKAISATAATITGAWIEAGRPRIGALAPRRPQRIDRGSGNRTQDPGN